VAYVYWAIPILLVAGMFIFFVYVGQSGKPAQFNGIYVFTGIFILLYVPKLFFIIFHFLDDIKDVIAWAVKKLSATDSATFAEADRISRSQFLTRVGIIGALLPFTSILYGMAWGRFDFKVRRHTLSFANLPKAFAGFKIVQISDIHLGSLKGDEEKFAAAIEMVNSEKPDLLLFTGDLVNNTADEIDGWEPIFSKLKSKYGNFSVLGNHDYGDYFMWKSPEAKRANLDRVIAKHKELGFNILLNENTVIEKDGEKIGLIGIENWGLPPFPQYGDLNKAMQGIENMPFKVLMSHDPSHWDAQVLRKTDIDISFAGHTHGMQFGIDIPGLRWSPVKFKYPRWAGLYTENNQHLYVNIGFGYIGFPGRVGTPPEITVIELQPENTSA